MQMAKWSFANCPVVVS